MGLQEIFLTICALTIIMVGVGMLTDTGKG